MSSEAKVQDDIRIALGQRPDFIAWRNNVGVAKHWNEKTQREDIVKYGLCAGSSDLVGIARGGRFVALEVKSETGRVTKEQATFIALVRHMGGVGEVVRSVEEAMAAVDRAVKGGDL
jgi:hypothetical protein